MEVIGRGESVCDRVEHSRCISLGIRRHDWSANSVNEYLDLQFGIFRLIFLQLWANFARQFIDDIVLHISKLHVLIGKY